MSNDSTKELKILASLSIQRDLHTLIDEVKLEGDKITFTLKDTNKRPLIRKLKNFLWGPISTVYLWHSAGQRFKEGYMCFPIEGGYVVVSPQGKEYHIDDQTCTCEDFLANGPGHRCKHMLMKDWFIEYRTKVAEYKRERGFK